MLKLNKQSRIYDSIKDDIFEFKIPAEILNEYNYQIMFQNAVLNFDYKSEPQHLDSDIYSKIFKELNKLRNAKIEYV